MTEYCTVGLLSFETKSHNTRTSNLINSLAEDLSFYSCAHLFEIDNGWQEHGNNTTNKNNLLPFRISTYNKFLLFGTSLAKMEVLTDSKSSTPVLLLNAELMILLKKEVKENKKRILKYLVPVKMYQGRLPSTHRESANNNIAMFANKWSHYRI